MPPWIDRYLLPVLFAVVLWWLATAVLIWLAHRSLPTVRRWLAAFSLLVVVACWQLSAGRYDSSSAGVYWAFGWATVVWGWLILSYYSGLITGYATPGPVPPFGWRRFWVALRAHLHHDLLALALFLVLIAIHYDAANMVGLWTYAVLWVMHASARLHLFVGVRTFNEALLPKRFVRAMGGLWRYSARNALFPFVVVPATLCDLLLIQRAATTASVAAAAGLSMLGCMLTLGIAEHWLLLLRWDLPLWNWAASEPAPVADEVPRAPSVAPNPSGAR